MFNNRIIFYLLLLIIILRQDFNMSGFVIRKESHRKSYHLRALSSYAANINPSLAQFYRITMKELQSTDPTGTDMRKESVVKELNTCAFCGCPLKVGNHSAKLLPRRPITQKMLALMQKFAKNPRSLGCYQQKLVRDYKSSRNKLEITCFSCKKKWKTNGQSYTERLKQREELTPKVPDIPKSKQEKKRDKKKALRKKKKLETDVDTAGLKFTKVQRDPTIDRSTALETKKETEDKLLEKKNVESKTTSASRLQLLEKLDEVKQTDLRLKHLADKERKKRRFTSKLSNILKQENAKEKNLKKATENVKKIDLQAFLSSL